MPRQRRDRRPVTLAASVTREDGSLVEMTIVDLSYDGCGVVCSGALVVGDRLNLSAFGRSPTPVTVRWTDGTRACLSFAPATSDDQPTRQPRRDERVSVEGEVTMHRRNKSNYRVHIYDLSPEQLQSVPSLPGSLDEALDALEADHEFLLKGDVFTTGLIDRWIGYKREKEIQPLRLRPHPLEFGMYYDI